MRLDPGTLIAGFPRLEKSTGPIRGVDQGAQAVGDLAGPDRAGVGPGGAFDVSEQVSCAQLVGDAGELVVVLVQVVHDDGAGQVGTGWSV